MRRTIANVNLAHIPSIETDVVIVGSGAAGLYTALRMDRRIDCILLNKLGPESCNSMYAQGGIAVVVGQLPTDNPDKHFHDTLVAGAGHCDEKAVRVLVDEGAQNIEKLVEMGVPFDRDNGGFSLTREGGHSEFRVIHSGGDATGLHLTQRLFQLAQTSPNIRILSYMLLTDIIADENGVAGIIAYDAQSRPLHIACRWIVMATGGIGRVYRNSTNAATSTGDGIAAASRAGAALKDMEFVQFHPTALVHPDQNGRFFLISEALRGEGAILRNRNSEAFMEGVHPQKDLAPRDIVSRAIISEMKRRDLPHVYLDITQKPRAFLRQRFPTIYGECMRRDIDIAHDWIPVIPVQHYFMGGIETDLCARTNVKNLFACGESACTGVHGANRLASNSLLECLVFGKRCADAINNADVPAIRAGDYEQPKQSKSADEYDLESFCTEIRELMTRKCSIIRNEEELLQVQSRVREVLGLLDDADLNTIKAVETYNIASTAAQIIGAAQMRKQSIGAHYRSDDLGGK